MAVAPQLRALLHAVNALLRKRRYHAALAMLKGFRNGAVYGAKIRAPHALVMTFLFRSGSLQEKLRAILQATYTHSRNLACFVFTYKGLCALQAHVQGETYQVHSFLAAFVGGLLLFGGNNNINSQISMYLLSRVLFALCRLGVEEGTTVTQIKRVRLINREPVSLEITYLSQALGERLENADLVTRDIFLILENDCGLQLGHADVAIDAVLADSELTQALNVEAGSPIMRIERLTHTADGQPVDFEHLYYRGDAFQYRLRIDRQRGSRP